MLGKSRVAPLKSTSIPRLKLATAVLGVRVDKMLRKELQLDLTPSIFWTDSMTVLRYVANETKRFHTFVANRVAVIREATDVAQLRHIGTKLNPADEASRGLSVRDLLENTHWLRGPEFFLDKEEDWPKSNTDQQFILVDEPKVKRGFVVNLAISKNTQCAVSKLLYYFSDWMKLKISVAWFLKLKNVLLELRMQRKSLQACFGKDKDGSTLSNKVEEEMR